MFLVFDDRESDSPFIERVWRTHSERAGSFVSVAASHLEMVVSRVGGKVFLTLRGPETRATHADCPADGEWLGIRFTLGTFLPHHPASTLIDRRDEHLPDLGGRFHLDGFQWEYPAFDTAETFVHRLHEAGYFDQAHLTRSLGRFIGQTPSRAARGDAQLSFLYKTTPRAIPMIASTHHDDAATLENNLDRTSP